MYFVYFHTFSLACAYKIPSSANFFRVRAWGYLGVKTCEVFLCFLAIIFLGSIVLTSPSGFFVFIVLRHS